jgi:hypothetical protein
MGVKMVRRTTRFAFQAIYRAECDHCGCWSVDKVGWQEAVDTAVGFGWMSMMVQVPLGKRGTHRMYCESCIRKLRLCDI